MPYKNPADERACRIRNNHKKLAYMKKYREAHREQEIKRSRDWYAENKSVATNRQRVYNAMNPGVNKAAVRKYRAKRKLEPGYDAEMAAKARKNRAANLENYRKNYRRCYAKRRENPSFVIECRLRSRLNKILRISKAPKFDSTFALVGCGIEFLRGYLEAKFTDGMQWNNVHIDHIKPVALFDLTNEDEQRAAFHYSNLQPLFSFDNMSKGASVP